MARDYRDVVVHKEKPEKKSLSGEVQQRWWEVDESELARCVVDTGTALERADGDRQAAIIRHARLYENCELDSLNGRGYSESVVRQIVLNTGFLSLNLGATCVDTLTSKITKNKPRPYFLTSGDSWAGQIKARNLDKWSRGFLYQTKFYQKGRDVFLDSGRFGTGLLQLYDCGNGKLEAERVLLNELFVDPLDGQYGSPRQMLRTKFVPRDILKRLYPKKAKEIDDAGKASRIENSEAAPEVVENTVQVWEAWHLPSDDKAKDGKHCICIDGACLMMEDWKIQRFPFAVHRYKKRTTGFWGKGIIETVQPIQVALNRAVRSVDMQMRRKGKGRTWVQIGSKVNVKAMTNADGGDIGYYTGSPPVVENNNAIAPEEIQYIQTLYTQGLYEVGLSELSANAKKPAGLDAAVALREYSDIESERFATQHQDWEQFGLDYMELAIDLITKQYGWKAYKVLVPGRRDLLEVDWANIDLDRDSYVLQMWPTSSLPQTPAARLQRVEELRAKGYITDAQAKRLLEFPDIEAEQHLGNAIIDDADATISAILDNDPPELRPLEPYQNLDMIIERANAAYLFARHRHCPEERLTLLRQLIDTATAQKSALMAPPAVPGVPGAGAPPMDPGAPMGAGGPPPTQINNTMNAAAPVPAVPPLIA